MEIGDIVGRAYVWPTLTPGIVIDMQEERVMGLPENNTEGLSYSVITYIVAWADGSVTNELDMELDLFDDILENISSIEK